MTHDRGMNRCTVIVTKNRALEHVLKGATVDLAMYEMG